MRIVSYSSFEISFRSYKPAIDSNFFSKSGSYGFFAAGLSLFSPPPLTNKKYKGLNSIKAHKYLASIHFSAMVATGIFKNRNIKIHKYSNSNLGLEIKLNDGYIYPLEITPEGKNRMKVEDYIRGLK